MKVAQAVLDDASTIATALAPLVALAPHLVLVFGAVPLMHACSVTLAEAFASSHRIGCSTAGEISAHGVADGTCVVTAVHFEHTKVAVASTRLEGKGLKRL